MLSKPRWFTHADICNLSLMSVPGNIAKYILTLNTQSRLKFFFKKGLLFAIVMKQPKVRLWLP